ncbi:MAG: hypothetical protein IH965_09885 [Gemmatimonadetes bacterium]|nr:hypothetical protein [Gemmatimonadota bacterium]
MLPWDAAVSAGLLVARLEKDDESDDFEEDDELPDEYDQDEYDDDDDDEFDEDDFRPLRTHLGFTCCSV